MRKSAPAQAVTGPGFRFAAPAGWQVKQAAAKVTAEPSPGSATLVSVAVFGLVRPYRPALWPRVVPELDRVARQLALKLDPAVPAEVAGRTVQVLGEKARQYQFSYRGLRQRLTFVLRGRMEYELICRWPLSDGEPPACAQLLSTFRLG